MRKQQGLAWDVAEELREGRGEYVAWQSLESRESNFERREKELEIKLGVGRKRVTSTGNSF